MPETGDSNKQKQKNAAVAVALSSVALAVPQINHHKQKQLYFYLPLLRTTLFSRAAANVSSKYRHLLLNLLATIHVLISHYFTFLFT